jgi:hypothetical protein
MSANEMLPLNIKEKNRNPNAYTNPAHTAVE